MISAEAFDRLRRIGETRGKIDVEALQQVIPVENCSTEELTDLILRLEDAGIAVDVNAALTAPRTERGDHGQTGANLRPSTRHSPSSEPVYQPERNVTDTHSAGRADPIADQRIAERGSLTTAKVSAAILVLALLILLAAWAVF